MGEEGGDSQGVFCLHAVAGGRESSLGQLQLLCGLVPFLPSIVFLTLQQGSSSGGAMGREWPLMLPQRPVDLTGDFHWPWWPSDFEGCTWQRVGVLGSPQRHSQCPSPARARWQQECDTYTWCRRSWTLQTHSVGIALISQCLNTLPNLRN